MIGLPTRMWLRCGCDHRRTPRFWLCDAFVFGAACVLLSLCRLCGSIAAVCVRSARVSVSVANDGCGQNHPGLSRLKVGKDRYKTISLARAWFWDAYTHLGGRFE